MKKNKLKFFSRVKLAVAKLEDYNVFINEKISVGLKYFFLIVLIFAFSLTVMETYDFSKKITKAYNYIKNELPSFQYLNGNLEFSQNVKAHDKELNFSLISDTLNLGTNENIKELASKIEAQGLILFKDKAVLVNNGNNMILNYSELQEQYGVTELDKNLLLEKIDSIGISGIIAMNFGIVLLGLLVFELIYLSLDCIMLSVFAYCAVKITRTDLNYKQTFNISIYSLTLPIFFYMIYSIANYIFGFYTQYFKTIYLLIAYVYVVAAILIIKSDMMKQKAEIGRIIENDKQANEEEKKLNEDEKENKMPEENKDEENETQDENDDGDVVEDEPDGSEI